MKRRVVITGIGVVSPIGIGKAAFWNGLKEGRSGIKPITLFDTSNFPVKFAGEVSDFESQKFMTVKQQRRLDRFAQLGMAAAKMAVAEAQLEIEKENRDRIGISIGTSIGPLAYAEKQLVDYLKKGIDAIHPFFASYVISSSCATELAIHFNASGPIYTNGNACTAATSAIGTAYHLIRNGLADVMISGGGEAPIMPVILGSLHATRIMSEEGAVSNGIYKAFSKDRSGVVLGEGAAIIILESHEHALNRSAKILAEFKGYGITSDAYHILLQPPDGQKAVRAIQNALGDAGLKSESIDYINAHGSGTLMNDKTETNIIKTAFGDRAYKIPISTTKPMIGHAMGACGALEIAACILMLEQQFLHPTINLDVPDPDCDLDYLPNKGREQRIDSILKISFGFGGYNTACVLSRLLDE